MRSVVRDHWIAFTEPMEGGCSCLYNDVRGLTTIAYGNLCNSPGEAAALPLVHPDGTPATVAEKIAAWHSVHDDPAAAHYGWRYAAKLTKLRLTPNGMAGLALQRLEQNDRILLARLPEWESYGACVQAALHSLSWAAGPHAHYPRLFEAVKAHEFATYTTVENIEGHTVDVLTGGAAFEIHMREITPEGIRNAGLVPRNVANKILMRNAQRVESYMLDPDTLNWTSIIGASDDETQPDISQPETEPPPPIPHIITEIPPAMEVFEHANPKHVESSPADGETIYPRPRDDDEVA